MSATKCSRVFDCMRINRNGLVAVGAVVRLWDVKSIA